MVREDYIPRVVPSLSLLHVLPSHVTAPPSLFSCWCYTRVLLLSVLHPGTAPFRVTPGYCSSCCYTWVLLLLFLLYNLGCYPHPGINLGC